MPEVKLIRRVQFSASHRLHASGLSDAENQKIFGKCNRANGHGHNYVAYIEVKGEVDPKTGMVMSLEDLKAAIERTVMARLDHKHLNLDVPEFKSLNPTAENIAIVLWRMLEPELPKGLLHKVTLHETENNIAVYKGK
jgi:6-pyruvoyltetrahydropterin/6-carboxytetrahydropterin synthase